jgi:hypothetical protein
MVKIAQRLSVKPFDVSLTAHKLWGHSLSEERDRRVAESAPKKATARSIQALRGHITRSLIEELQPALEKGKKK